MISPVQRLPNPPLLQRFPFNYAMRRLAPSDVRATAEQRDAFLRFTRQGDPEADGVVAMFRRMPPREGRRLFELAVEHGIESLDSPPPELRAFFASVDHPPYWVDPDKLARASAVIARTGVVAGFTSLAMIALMGGYLASRVAKTLVGTRDLEQLAPQRLASTTAWYTQVTAPGGLDRYAPGFKATLRVRLMHALVRAGMSRRPDWDFEKWDVPVNASQVAGTAMLFALANIAGSQAMGLHFSAAEKADVYHFWRYTGHLLGVRPEILFADEHDFWRMLWLQSDYELGHPDEDSVKLAQALVKAIGPLVAGTDPGIIPKAQRYVVTGFMVAYARLTLGKYNADFLQLPDQKPFQAIVIATATALKLSEIPRRVIPGATRWREVRGGRSKAAMVDRMLNAHGADGSYSRHDRMVEPAAAHSPAEPTGLRSPHQLPPSEPSQRKVPRSTGQRQRAS